jgi:uncharacterized protein YjiS (DUF1127 family)
MTAQHRPDRDRPYPVVQSFIETFAAWLKHRRELSELRQMDRGDFDRIAADLRVSPSDLDELVRHGPHAADELPRMLKALGIDEQTLARTQPMVLRDMERVCALCDSKSRCDRDLDAGTAAGHYEEYCLNAPTLDDLEREAAK